MATKQLVELTIWNDKWFKKLDNSSKLLFLHILLNPQMTPSGMFELPEEYPKYVLGFDDLEGALKKLEEKVGYDDERGIVWVKNYYRKNSQSPKMRRSVVNTLSKFHDSPLIQEFKNYYRYPIDTVSILSNDNDNDNDHVNDHDINKVSTALQEIEESVDEVDVPPTQEPTIMDSYLTETPVKKPVNKTTLTNNLHNLIIQTYLEKKPESIRSTTLKSYHNQINTWVNESGYTLKDLLEIVTNYTLFFQSGKAGDFPKASFANFLKKDDYSKWLDEFDPDNLKSSEEKKAKHEQILEMDFDSVFEGN